MRVVATDGEIYIRASLVLQLSCGIKYQFRFVFITHSLVAFEYILREGFASVKYSDDEIYVRIYTIIKLLYLENTGMPKLGRLGGCIPPNNLTVPPPPQ